MGGCGGRHHERRHPERLGVDAERERGHRRVAGQRHLVDLGRVDAGLGAHVRGELGQGLPGRGLQPVERPRVEHRGADPGDHVAAEGLLAVEHRGHRERGAGGDVEQGRDHGRGPEVERDRVAPAGGVTRLHVDEGLVDDHRGHLEVGLAQHAGQPAQHVQVGRRGQVVDRGEQPVEVGALVGQGRLVELDVPLLQGRPQDHLPADTDGGGLGARGQRRYVDLEVAGRLHQAGQPPPVVELLAGEGAQVVARDRARPLDPDPALVAGAVAAAGGVDGDAVPRRGVEDRDAGRHPHRALGRRRVAAGLDGERELDPAGAVVRDRLGAGRLEQALPADLVDEEVAAREVGGIVGRPVGHAGSPRGRERSERSRGVLTPLLPASCGGPRSRPCPTRRGRAAGPRP